jgi:hypothetical protein
LEGREEYEDLITKTLPPSYMDQDAASSPPDHFDRFSLQHWVRSNSFVQRQYASWRERMEDIVTDPYSLWRLCMASAFGNRCPNLIVLREQMEAVLFDKDDMSNNRNTIMDWSGFEGLVGGEEEQYVAIAKQMALEYGYDDNVSGNHVNDSNVSYDCGFGHAHTKKNSEGLWDCWLTSDRKI